MRKLYRLVSEAHSAVNDAFRTARHFHESSDALNERIAKIRTELNSRTRTRYRYSQYERYEVSGFIAARYEDVWQHVEFCYRDASGTLFSVDRNSAHRKTQEFYDSDRGQELGQLEHAYVWKGTDKTYTRWTRS